MSRKVGWYWVKVFTDGYWEVAYWDGEIFENVNWYMYGDDLAVIGERIEEPRE